MSWRRTQPSCYNHSILKGLYQRLWFRLRCIKPHNTCMYLFASASGKYQPQNIKPFKETDYFQKLPLNSPLTFLKTVSLHHPLRQDWAGVCRSFLKGVSFTFLLHSSGQLKPASFFKVFGQRTILNSHTVYI